MTSQRQLAFRSFNSTPSPGLILLSTTVALLLTAITASAQYVEPPVIMPTNLDRSAYAEAAADDNFCDRDETLYDGTGAFPAFASIACSGEYGSSANGTAQQLTHISSFSIRGTGSTTAETEVGAHQEAWSGLNVHTRISVSFTVPVDAVLWLRGSFAVTENDPEGTCGEDTMTWVFFSGTDVNGAQILLNKVFNCLDPPEQADFELFDTLQANTPVTFFVLAQSGLGTEFPTHRLGERTASFDFAFDLGLCDDPCVPYLPEPGDPNWDLDYDGLIDGWEEDGIDFDGDGMPEIDLPGLGAIVGTRDIFVEVDIMEGAAFDQAAIDDVIRAFAEAPPARPDGNPGINLTVLVDTDQPAHVPLQQLPNGDLPPEYYIIKNAFFGTALDRSHPDWDEIRPVRLGIFRYCLWGDTIRKPNGRLFSGLAEAIPSNDFFVAGSVQSWFTDPANSTNGLAGTFMHELGHTLGLYHGGGNENTPNYKPNYLSVMNYAYQLPFEVVTPEGTEASDAWRLDFSRSSTRSLDENQLVEIDGLDGPAGRMMLFNSALPGGDSVINIGWASTDWVDWNNNGVADALAYERDISNFFDDSLSLDILNSYTDWNQLQIDLSGGSQFNDRQPWPHARRIIEEGIVQDSFLDIQNADWVDQTALGNLIFENGLDLGSTTAWSETVP